LVILGVIGGLLALAMLLIAVATAMSWSEQRAAREEAERQTCLAEVEAAAAVFSATFSALAEPTAEWQQFVQTYSDQLFADLDACRS
jgi:Na+-transporting methylmalonyl-CoA/oxaloacetate decarboxylase gamma subunit